MAYGFYKSVTIDHLQVGASDLTNFAVTIFVTDADLKTIGNGGSVQNSSGYDIRPYSDSGLTSALDYERVYYLDTAGTLEMHVRLPTISHTSDTVFYLGIGDANLSTDGSAASTWNSTYKAVWHFPDGTTLSANDSTSNASHGTINGATTAITGELDGGMSADTLSGPDSVSNALTIPTQGTISFWFSPTSWDSGDSVDRGLFGKGESTTNLRMLRCQRYLDNNWYIGFYNDQAAGEYRVIVSDATFTVAHATWYYFAFTWNSGTQLSAVYKNGVLQGTNNTLVLPTYNEATFYLGLYHVSNVPISVGAKSNVDEFRLQDTDRPADWLLAEYNNQMSPSTFVVFGGLNVFTAPITSGPPLFRCLGG